MCKFKDGRKFRGVMAAPAACRPWPLQLQCLLLTTSADGSCLQAKVPDVLLRSVMLERMAHSSPSPLHAPAGEWDDDGWVQSAADPQNCRLAGPGITKAIAGKKAEFAIEVGCSQTLSGGGSQVAFVSVHVGVGEGRPAGRGCQAHYIRPCACLLPPQARDDNGCLRLSGGDEFQAALLGPARGARAKMLPWLPWDWIPPHPAKLPQPTGP